MAAGPTNFDTLNAMTQAYVDEKFNDAIFGTNPLLKKLRANQRTYPGSDTIRVRIEYAMNPNGKWITGSEPWTNAKHEFATMAEFTPKVRVEPMVVLMDDLDACQGPSAFGNLMADTLANAKKTSLYYFTTGVFSDGTGSANKQITGLASICDDGSNVATYGGINKLTYTWWAGHYSSAGGASISIPLLQGLWGDCCDGDERPDLLLTSQDLWDSLAIMAEVAVRSGHADLRRNIGTNELTFHGVPITVDSQCPSDRFYMTNTKHLSLRPHKDYANFKFSGWQAPLDQRILTANLQWVGEMVCTNPRYQGVLDTLVA
jgi:hypothetical protein